MDFEIRQDALDGGISVVSVHGELDLATARELTRALRPAIRSGTPVVLDLCECWFVDSTGLGAIVAADRKLRRRTGRSQLCVVAPDGQVRRLFAVTGMERSISLATDRDEAVRALADGGPPSSDGDPRPGPLFPGTGASTGKSTGTASQTDPAQRA